MSPPLAPKEPWTAPDHEQSFRLQLRFLRNSARLYDDGQEDEAIRLALTLRVLLHDTKTSTSVLRHLQVKEKIQFFDTSAPASFSYSGTRANDFDLHVTAGSGETIRLRGSDAGLVDLSIESPPRYVPRRETRPLRKQLAFEDWWTKPVMDAAPGDPQISRKKLVLWTANEDGGAHVDQVGRTEAYAHFRALGYGPDWAGAETGPGLRDFKPLMDAGLAAVRQIAFEAERSFAASPDLSALCT